MMRRYVKGREGSSSSSSERKKYNYHALPQDKKLFVGGLPIGISHQEFETYFGEFGNMTDCVIIHDKQTRRARGFGFVSYDSDEAVDAVLQKQFHTLKGKAVEVKMAQPKNNIMIHSNSDNIYSNRICYYVSPHHNPYYYYHPPFAYRYYC